MENLKPDLDIFDDPRFGEWRPGNDKDNRDFWDTLFGWFLS
jgi:hypothetical protein